MKHNSTPFDLSWTTLALLLAGGFTLPLQGQVVDFSDIALDPESAWVGPVESGTEGPGPFGGTERSGYLESGGVRFANSYNLDFQSWSGFAVSNSTDTTTAGFTNDTSAIAGGGSSDANYAVGFGYVHGLDPSDLSQLEQLPRLELPAQMGPVSVEVTNATYPALSMQHGDAFAKKFGGNDGSDPDFFELQIFGSQASVPLDAVITVALADYRFEDPANDFIRSTWHEVDLAPFAGADRLFFNLRSSDNGLFGMNTPAYFALDNLQLAARATVDFDQDGVVTVVDIDRLCHELSAGGTDPRFDHNLDGRLDSADLDSYLAATGRLPGDIDFDGAVVFQDFLFLAKNFGEEGNWSHGDVDCNGMVQFPDFTRLAANFGKVRSSQQAAAVPEPVSAAGLLLGLLCMAGWTRGRKNQ